MTWSLDARIPVFVCQDAAALAAHADAALLLPDGEAVIVGTGACEWFGPETHAVGCSCCAGRLPAAVAFDRLFLDRVRGVVPFFRSVAALDGGPAETSQVLRALAQDAVVGARFRKG